MSNDLHPATRTDAVDVASADPSRHAVSAHHRNAAACLLTVIVPVYNEEATLDEQLRQVERAFPDKEVIVVDDGSTDRSAEILADWKYRPGFLVLKHAANRGKGAAIRTALPHARGRFSIIQDADMENDPQDYDRLLRPLQLDHADVVYGSRYLRSANKPARWTVFRLGVVVLNAAVRLLYGIRLTDEATCYKVLPTAQLRRMQLECERFEFCPEVTAKACRLGLRIVEVPVQYTPRRFAGGKKLRLRDGWLALATLWKWRTWVEPADVDCRTRKPRGDALHGGSLDHP